MNTELKDALEILSKERDIPREALLAAIESALLTACRNHFDRTDHNCYVEFDPDTCEYQIYQRKNIVEEVLDPVVEISLPDALMIDENAVPGGSVSVPVDSQAFGRISTQNAKGVIKQKIREEERSSIYREFLAHEHDIMTGIVQRNLGRNLSINLGKTDAILNENEQIRGENLRQGQRVKVYLLRVEESSRGPRISVSRTHPDLVKCLFKDEISEIAEGVVEIMEIAREAGSRTKIAVISHDANVDPVGACVGVNGVRVNSIVEELGGEKIDIVNWDENPAYFIENAISPAKVICVVADEDTRGAVVIVPDYQLSLAIGKEGQNARLAAKLTGYKIDIKSESQAEESGLLEELGIESSGEEEYLEGDFSGDEAGAYGEGDAACGGDALYGEDDAVYTDEDTARHSEDDTGFDAESGFSPDEETHGDENR